MKALSQRAMVLGFLVPGDDWEKIRNTNQQVQPLPGLQIRDVFWIKKI